MSSAKLSFLSDTVNPLGTFVLRLLDLIANVCGALTNVYFTHRNDTFNKGKHRSKLRFAVGFVPGLVKALTYEFYMLLAGRLDRYVLVKIPLSFGKHNGLI